MELILTRPITSPSCILTAPDITIAMKEEDPDRRIEDNLVTIPLLATMNTAEDDQDLLTMTAVTLIMKEENPGFEQRKEKFIVINLDPVNVTEKTTGPIITIHLQIEIDMILGENMRHIHETKNLLIFTKGLPTNKEQKENALKKIIWQKPVPYEVTKNEKHRGEKRKRDEDGSPYDTHRTKVTNFLNSSPCKSQLDESSDDAESQNSRMSEDIKTLRHIEREHADYLKKEIENFEKRQPHIAKYFHEVQDCHEFAIYYNGAAIEWGIYELLKGIESL
ncbi:hypothetical protein HELRODRAFT_182968 [Helobdella robusta]|uniref:Uncharacterized protein n=1 Tax=Helobdella robusta TaxID=6412 RepID=T1FJ04_HELRO|nr:hypothetical protein HELRODRAFT_182968 [Helobdella robusta]ESN89959.1 hypothetical protein HELRODRAFT_182968 [Helobdella robusta]